MAMAARQSTAEPERRCIASGEVRPQRELLRFVVAPDGTLTPDPAAKLPGRGLWLRPRRDMIEKARRRRLFARAAKAPVRVPDDLEGQVERLLRRRCLDGIGLAARAGQAVAGYVKVRHALERASVGLLLEARDGAADGRGKLRRLGRAAIPGLPVIDAFDSVELGQALGRAPTVHVAVRPGGLAERLRTDCGRLADVLNEAKDAWGAEDGPGERTLE